GGPGASRTFYLSMSGRQDDPERREGVGHRPAGVRATIALPRVDGDASVHRQLARVEEALGVHTPAFHQHRPELVAHRPPRLGGWSSIRHDHATEQTRAPREDA